MTSRRGSPTALARGGLVAARMYQMYEQRKHAEERFPRGFAELPTEVAEFLRQS